MLLPNPTHYSVFLDNSELYSESGFVTVPQQVGPSVVRTTFFVSQLTIEERAVQLRDQYQKLRLQLGQFAPLLKGAADAEKADIGYFRSAVTDALKGVPC